MGEMTEQSRCSKPHFHPKMTRPYISEHLNTHYQTHIQPNYIPWQSQMCTVPSFEHVRGFQTYNCEHSSHERHTHRHTHGWHSSWPDSDRDSCVIISSTPPFPNKPLLLLSPPVKLLISTATRGDDKSLLHRDESHQNSPLLRSCLHTESSMLFSLVLCLLHRPSINSPLSN